VRGESGALPGEPGERYWSLPLPLIPSGRADGGAVRLLRPGIGFVMVGWAAWTKLSKKKVEAPAAVAPEAAEGPSRGRAPASLDFHGAGMR